MCTIDFGGQCVANLPKLHEAMPIVNTIYRAPASDVSSVILCGLKIY